MHGGSRVNLQFWHTHGMVGYDRLDYLGYLFGVVLQFLQISLRAAGKPKKSSFPLPKQYSHPKPDLT